jgi:hypothetical protein
MWRHSVILARSHYSVQIAFYPRGLDSAGRGPRRHAIIAVKRPKSGESPGHVRADSQVRYLHWIADDSRKATRRIQSAPRLAVTDRMSSSAAAIRRQIARANDRPERMRPDWPHQAVPNAPMRVVCGRHFIAAGVAGHGDAVTKEVLPLIPMALPAPRERAGRFAVRPWPPGESARGAVPTVRIRERLRPAPRERNPAEVSPGAAI